MSTVKITEQKEGTIIHLNGKFIGGDETYHMRDELQKLMDKGIMTLIIDMENVSYLNSTALGILISTHANFIKRGGKVLLSSLGKSVMNLFVITKLTMVFPIYVNLDEAIKSISE